eukprot:3005192-Amphidinium_carterae.1
MQQTMPWVRKSKLTVLQNSTTKKDDESKCSKSCARKSKIVNGCQKHPCGCAGPMLARFAHSRWQNGAVSTGLYF